MVSAFISWYGEIKNNNVNSNGIKFNKENYCRHWIKELFPAIEKVVKRDDWIFAQDGAQSHWSHLLQDFLKVKLKSRFIRAEEQPLSSPDVNPLDCFYWDFVKTKVYKGRSEKPFASEAELKRKIKSVWNICEKDLVLIKKAISFYIYIYINYIIHCKIKKTITRYLKL